MSSHTEGPWKVSETGSDVEQDSEAAFGICALYADESSSANARLIAAAPELLAACERAVKADDMGDDLNWVEACETAIAKATG